MRIRRLIQKKTKKFIIRKLKNNFSTLFQSFNLSDRRYCDIPYVKLKFFKSSSLANAGEIINLKIDGQILPKIIETGKFDEFIFKFLKKKLKKKSLFIDVGSNHGFISKQIANIKNIKKIIVFEPVTEIFNLSKMNLNKISNVQYNNYGWAKKVGKFFFYQNLSNSGDYSLIKSKQRQIKHIYKFKKANKELTKIINVNKNLNLILKTDCQGYDIEIFCDLSIDNLRKINMYFLECREVSEKNKINFYNKVKLFKKIFVSCPLIHKDTREISIEKIKEYFNYKVELDLILIN
tara:strand:+ start:111 stop:986 length:876 start_codon:yes stop_codon:yes gene_type:complete